MDSRFIILALSTLAHLRAAKRPPPSARSVGFGIVCVILAIGVAAAAIGCAAVALWIYALPSLGATGTPLVVALALALVCGALAILVCRPWRHRRALAHPAPDAALGGDLPGLADLARLARGNAGTLVIAAIVAGLVAGTGASKSGHTPRP